MAKTARKKTAVAKHYGNGDKMIDGSRYGFLVYVDPDTGKTVRSKGNLDAIHHASCWFNTADKTLKDIAKANGVEDFDPATHPNAGKAKMALNQKLRAKIRAGIEVTIAGHVIKKLDQKVPLPKAA